MRMARLLGALLACAPLAFAAGASASTERGSSSETSSTEAGRAAGRAAPGNPDRRHSPPIVPARGRFASQSGHPVGSTKIATDDRVVRGVRNARVGQAKLPVSKFAIRAATSVNTVARTSTPGAPRAAGLARIGGPAIARTTNNASVNGAQLHRKP
jgi:hypothetical protein